PLARGSPAPPAGPRDPPQAGRGRDRSDRRTPRPRTQRGARRDRPARPAQSGERALPRRAHLSRQGRGPRPPSVRTWDPCPVSTRDGSLRPCRCARPAEPERGFRHPAARGGLAPPADRHERPTHAARPGRRCGRVRGTGFVRRGDRRHGAARPRSSARAVPVAGLGGAAMREAAATEKPDLLLVSWRRPGWDVLGTTIEEVLRDPPCDVAVVKGAPGRAKRILVPVRGGRYAQLAARTGVDLA